MAMSTGKVVALIQAMGGGADPAAIEAAVQDWLDAHPEATTTVQDGSITEQKLATAVAQKLGLISQLSDEIVDLTGIKLNKIITSNANVFNKADAKTGKKISGGTETDDSSAFYCEIPVREGDIVRFPYSSTYKNLVAYGFDNSGNPVTWLAYTYFDASGNASNTELPAVQTVLKNGLYVYGRNTVDASGNLMFTDDGSVTIGTHSYNIKKHIVPANVVTMKINFSLSLIDDYMVTVNNAYPTSYQAYSEFNAETLLQQLNGGTEIDALNGKTLVSLGDSIAYGAGNPQGGGIYKSYANMIAEKHVMTLTNYAVTGATLCPTLDANKNVCDQVSTLLSSNIVPDVILVEGGINDIHNNYDYEANRGAIISPETNNAYTTLITDETKATVCGALEWIFCKLKMAYPSAIVIFIAVHRATSRNMTRQAQLHSDEMTICEKWAIPVVNIYENGLLNTKIIEMRDAFTLILSDTQIGDGIHPNEAGYQKFYVPMIETTIAEFIH